MKTTFFKILIIAAVLTGCKEKIDLNLNTSASKIVIEGSVTNELKKQKVMISRTTGFFSQGQIPRVTGATVTIDDGQNQFLLKETDPGIYYSETAFTGVPGKTYTLTVNVNGQSFFATTSMIPVTQVDSIAIEKATNQLNPDMVLDPKKQWFNILLYCQEPGYMKNFYLMDAYKNGKLMTDTITKKGFSDDMLYNGSFIDGTKTLQVDANIGDSITFQLSSIDQQYYQYLRGIYETVINGSPFAGPPSNVKGNISGGAFGYFYAAAVSFGTKVVK
jgi:hypothetical protein